MLDGGGPISPERADAIEGFLILEGCRTQHEILIQNPESAPFGINWCGLTQEGTMFLVNCANLHTVEVVVDRMAGKWTGSGVKVLRYQDLPKPCQISAFIPKMVFGRDDLLMIMAAQNCHLNLQISKWKIRIFDRKAEGGVFLKIDVPDADGEIIQSRKHKLGIGNRYSDFKVTWEGPGGVGGGDGVEGMEGVQTFADPSPAPSSLGAAGVAGGGASVPVLGGTNPGAVSVLSQQWPTPKEASLIVASTPKRGREEGKTFLTPPDKRVVGLENSLVGSQVEIPLDTTSSETIVASPGSSASSDLSQTLMTVGDMTLEETEEENLLLE
ncbi:hypothetical protein GE061_002032 [Apolygus lucorum]|uniref:DUF4780 domain-containing protein n=1 Tax=Apolygus lucorum TaxID=248454 RepID=A0A8S9X5E3_APOLU|nr:hypothetical protein GE061_002032 [Apolygus lucorum]